MYGAGSSLLNNDALAWIPLSLSHHLSQSATTPGRSLDGTQFQPRAD